MWTALRAAEQGAAVCVISRTPLSQSASFWAQGGLAAALEPGDSPAQHAADTIAAGRGLCRASAVQALVEEAPQAVRELRERGVAFDLDPSGELSLGLEGGHTRRRIVHARGSQTGREITAKLAAMVAAEPRIDVRERTSAVALWSDGERCHGLLTDDEPIAATATVIATGGAAALWRRTSNPRGAIGAGAVMAAAAGADLADLEFCQFHPTALELPGSRFDGMLITEATRGEGATLLDASGRRFTDELAPRDAVTAAILDRIEADEGAGVRLDLREVDPERFPSVFASLREAGLDPDAEPVPVAPAAHYTMGGIAVDLDGRSSLSGPLRRRRVLLYRPARRQPPRLELAQRVLRLRRTRRPRRACGSAGERPTGAGRLALRAADRSDPRRGLAPRRANAPIRAAARAARRPLPARGGDRRLRAGARGVARRPPARRLPGARPGARRRPHRARPGRRDPPRAMALS